MTEADSSETTLPWPLLIESPEDLVAHPSLREILVTACCHPWELKGSPLESLFIGSKVIDFWQVLFHTSPFGWQSILLFATSCSNPRTCWTHIFLLLLLGHSLGTDVLGCQEMIDSTSVPRQWDEKQEADAMRGCLSVPILCPSQPMGKQGPGTRSPYTYWSSTFHPRRCITPSTT